MDQEDKKLLVSGVLAVHQSIKNFQLALVKTLALLNGGAVITVLTLMGAAWSSVDERSLYPVVVWSIALFLVGAGTYAFYRAESIFLQDFLRDDKDSESKGWPWENLGGRLCVASLVLFITGVGMEAWYLKDSLSDKEATADITDVGRFSMVPGTE